MTCPRCLKPISECICKKSVSIQLAKVSSSKKVLTLPKLDTKRTVYVTMQLRSIKSPIPAQKGKLWVYQPRHFYSISPVGAAPWNAVINLLQYLAETFGMSGIGSLTFYGVHPHTIPRQTWAMLSFLNPSHHKKFDVSYKSLSEMPPNVYSEALPVFRQDIDDILVYGRHMNLADFYEQINQYAPRGVQLSALNTTSGRYALVKTNAHRMYMLFAYALLGFDIEHSGHEIASLLVSPDGRVLSWGLNNSHCNPTFHAEVSMLQRYYYYHSQCGGCENCDKGQIPMGSIIYTTLKSCWMCAGMAHDYCNGRQVTVIYNQNDDGRHAHNTPLDLPMRSDIRQIQLDGKNGIKPIKLYNQSKYYPKLRKAGLVSVSASATLDRNWAQYKARKRELSQPSSSHSFSKFSSVSRQFVKNPSIVKFLESQSENFNDLVRKTMARKLFKYVQDGRPPMHKKRINLMMDNVMYYIVNLSLILSGSDTISSKGSNSRFNRKLRIDERVLAASNVIHGLPKKIQAAAEKHLNDIIHGLYDKIRQSGALAALSSLEICLGIASLGSSSSSSGFNPLEWLPSDHRPALTEAHANWVIGEASAAGHNCLIDSLLQLTTTLNPQQRAHRFNIIRNQLIQENLTNPMDFLSIHQHARRILELIPGVTATDYNIEGYWTFGTTLQAPETLDLGGDTKLRLWNTGGHFEPIFIREEEL
ncbi:Bd3614 family nucleic acid deaminase [Aliikangiella coralliicola]|nr:Bd3614 family nucleic acid deaminase [Aliikangiella coralliicola]